MNILIDMGHPAHVHFYRNAIKILEGHGHSVTVTATDKDVVLDLLRAYDIPYVLRGRYNPSVVGKAINLPRTALRIARIGSARGVKTMSGINNPYVAQASRLLGIPSVIFDDTETATLINATTFAFASLICTPRRFLKDLGTRQLKYDGFHELAYLHPSYFAPDPSVGRRLSPNSRPYVIVRLVAWSASHDSQRLRSHIAEYLAAGGVKRLSALAQVWIVSEGPLPDSLRPYAYPLPPETVLDALAGCAAYVGEGATMATEAAILGRPSVYVSAMRFGSMLELEERFGLLRTLSDPGESIRQVEAWLGDPATSVIHAERRTRLLRETIDVTGLLVRLLSSPDPRGESTTIEPNPYVSDSGT